MIRSNAPHFMVDENWRISACDSKAAGWLGRSVPDVIGQLCFDVVDGYNLDGSPFCRPECPLHLARRRSLMINPVMVLNYGHSPRHLVKMHYVMFENPLRIMHIVRPLDVERKPSYALTPNQLQLVQALASGMTHRQIAQARNVAVSTVTTQLKRIRRALSCSSDTNLIRWYWNHGPG